MAIWTPDSEIQTKELDKFLDEWLEEFKLLDQVDKLIEQWKIEEADKLLFEIQLRLKWKEIAKQVGETKKVFTKSLEKTTWTNPFDEKNNSEWNWNGTAYQTGSDY